MIRVLGTEGRLHQSGQEGLLWEVIFEPRWEVIFELRSEHVKEDLGKNILNTCSAKALKQGNVDVLVRKK